MRIKVTQAVARYVNQSGKTHAQIGEEMGYGSQGSKLIEMFISGRSKLPINKVSAFARAVNTDPAALLRVVLHEYSPDTLKAIEEVAGRRLDANKTEPNP